MSCSSEPKRTWLQRTTADPLSSVITVMLRHGHIGTFHSAECTRCGYDWDTAGADFCEGVDMLILTRRVGETLMIGDEITVCILSVKGSQVRVGINAPRNVAVHREEIYKRIQQEQEQLGETRGEVSGETR